MLDELLSPLFTTLWGRRLGVALLLIMATLIVYTVSDVLFTWRADVRLTTLSTQSIPSTDKELEQLALRITQIPDQHVFGQAGVTDANALPITSLQIHLLGIVKATPDRLSRALISEQGQLGKVYQVGDSLPSSGVKIYAITAEGVVLENRGRYEKLPLSRSRLQFQGMPKPLLEEQ